MKKPTDSNDWAYTNLDKFIMAIKKDMGQENLRELLQSYNWISDVDPLFIMNVNKDVDYGKMKKELGAVATKIEDTDYLPMNLEHDDDYSDNTELSYTDRVSRALTIATFLLYTMRNDSLATSVDFTHNIVPPCKPG